MTRLADPTRASPSRRPAVVVVLLVLAAVVVASRAATYDEPLENDVAGYAVIAREMGRGRLLYSDLWERKPPLLYAAFVVGQAVAGAGRPAVFAVNVAAALATLAAVFAAARAMSGTTAGLAAAAAWAVVGGDLYLQANQPNAEALANPCLAAFVALLMGRVDSDRRGWTAVWPGLCLAAATGVKHHLAAGGFVILIGSVFAVPGGVGRRSRDAGVIVAVVAVCWAATAGYFAATGRLGVFVETLVGQNVGYAGNPVANLIAGLSPAVAPLGWVVGPAIVVGGGLAFGRWTRARPGAVRLLVAWAVAAWTAEALPGKLFPHYFQYWLPVGCIASGMAVAALLVGRASVAAPLRYGTIVVATGLAVARQAQPYGWPVDRWADVKYPGGNYAQQKYLGRSLRDRVLRLGETFWVAGDDTSLYFESGVSPPTGLLYVDPLTDGPNTAAYNGRLVRDLSARPPDLILLTPLVERFPPDAPVFRWMDRNYRPWPTPLGGRVYRLLVRRGSPLARRVGEDGP